MEYKLSLTRDGESLLEKIITADEAISLLVGKADVSVAKPTPTTPKPKTPRRVSASRAKAPKLSEDERMDNHAVAMSSQPTERQGRIMDAIKRGLTNDEVANLVSVSGQLVAYYRRKMKQEGVSIN